MSDERLQLLTTSNAILSEGGSLSTLKNTYVMDVDQIYTRAEELHTGVALEPLSTATTSGRKLEEKSLTAEQAAATGMLLQPPRSERNMRDFSGGIVHKVFVALYAHTHRYRETSGPQLMALQDTIQEHTGKTVPVQVHEPLDPRLAPGHQVDSFLRERDDFHQFGPNQALTFYKDFFNQVILRNESDLNDSEKLKRLMWYLRHQGQKLALPLVNMLAGKMFDNAQSAVQVLVKEDIVTAIKLEPDRNDLPQIKDASGSLNPISMSDMLPFVHAAIQALPKDKQLYLLYEGRNASQDVPHLQNVLHIPARRT